MKSSSGAFQPVTLKITQLLGYSEVNAFSRTFKKWTGMTVTDYKKQQGL
ncbi:helix-turn-helix domain-containing protein [Streptococcus suis]|nr:hypothetical protein [Streptococcus suis]